VDGAQRQGVPKPTADAIFDDWEAFARYGFPKGHAADYAVICVETAYLKANYPLEYMTALLSVFKHVTDRVALYVAECRRMGLQVRPPDVSFSGLDFEIEQLEDGQGAIRFGMGAVKNVGEGAVEAVLRARREGGPFRDVEEFARRVDLRQVGKRALECLVRVGALDRFGGRLELLETLDRIHSFSASQFRAAEVGQLSLFGAATGVAERLELMPAVVEVSQRRQLAWERELLGTYVSDHPLASHMEELARVVTHFSGELTEEDHEQPVCVAGEIAAVRPYKSRSGKDMGFVSLEDIQGTLELVIFNRLWQGLQGKLEPGQIAVARGRVDAGRGEPKILVDELILDLDKIRALEPGPERGSQDPNERPEAGPVSHETPNGSNGGDPGDLPSLEEGLEAGGLAAELLDEPLPEAPLLDGRTPEGESMVWQLAEGRQVTITLRSTGDQGRDAQRLRRIHGMLSSAPGGDHYSFLVYEASRCYHLEFPNSTTRYSLELHQLLMGLLGERAVQVEPLGLQ